MPASDKVIFKYGSNGSGSFEVRLFLVAALFLAWIGAAGAQERENTNPHTTPGPGEPGNETWEGDSWKTGGGSAWLTGSFDPELNLLYWGIGNPGPDWNGDVRKGDATYVRGERYIGSFPRGVYPDVMVDTDPGYGAVRALDPKTGERKWEYKMTSVTEGGILTTAGDVLFSGNMEGHVFALDVHDGSLLWSRNLGGRVISAPITYLVDDQQHFSIISGHSLYTFVLKD